MAAHKIFISYDWSTPASKIFARKLGHDLEEREFEVIADFSSDLGRNDKDQWMRTSIEEADSVIVVSSAEYYEKALVNEGGVGVEIRAIERRHNREAVGSAIAASSIFVVQRAGIDQIPSFLNKYCYDFSNNDNQEYQTAFNELYRGIVHRNAIPIPNASNYDFDRAEDLLRINFKRLEKIVSVEEVKAYSESTKTAFEVWEAIQGPSIQLFLIIPKSAVLADTILTFLEFLERKKIASEYTLTILRSDQGRDYAISRPLRDAGFNRPYEISTFADYFWEYCVDTSQKSPNENISTQRYFVDQCLFDSNGTKTAKGAAAHVFDSMFRANVSESSYVHLITAQSGMGKTTLARSLVQLIYAKKDVQCIPILIEASEFRNKRQAWKEFKISTLFELYRAHRIINMDSGGFQEEVTFNLAVECGKVAIVIDGLDELITLFEHRLDLPRFFASIETRLTEMGTAKVFMTSRGQSMIADVTEPHASHFKLLRLRGFDEDDIESYLEKRYKNSSSDASLLRSMAKRFLKRLSGWREQETNRVIPYALDLICVQLETMPTSDRDVATSFSDSEFESRRYSSRADLEDYFVFSIIWRELARHDLEVSVEQLIAFFSYLAGECGDKYSESEMKNFTDIELGKQSERVLAKLKMNPLLKENKSGTYSFRHDFLDHYFTTQYLIENIERTGIEQYEGQLGDYATTILSESAYGDGKTISDLIDYFSDTWERSAHPFFATTKRLHTEYVQSTNKHQRAKSGRALSALLHVFEGVFKPKDRLMRTQEILRLFGDAESTKGRVEGLCIYGDFPPLDFSGHTFTACYFEAYTGMFRSKLSPNITTFFDCVFENHSHCEHKSSLPSSAFDGTCKLNDLKDYVTDAERGVSQADLSAALHKFFSSFVYNGGFTTAHRSATEGFTVLESARQGFLEHFFMKEIIIEKDEETLSVGVHYQEDIRKFLDNNRGLGRFKNVLEIFELDPNQAA